MLKHEKGKVFEKKKLEKLSYRICVSLISEFLKDNSMNYTLSVFLPESEYDKEVLSRNELIELLSMRNSRLGEFGDDSLLESIIGKVFERKIVNPKSFNV